MTRTSSRPCPVQKESHSLTPIFSHRDFGPTPSVTRDGDPKVLYPPPIYWGLWGVGRERRRKLRMTRRSTTGPESGGTVVVGKPSRVDPSSGWTTRNGTRGRTGPSRDSRSPSQDTDRGFPGVRTEDRYESGKWRVSWVPSRVIRPGRGVRGRVDVPRGRVRSGYGQRRKPPPTSGSTRTVELYVRHL